MSSTIKDIAKELGISPSTVSRALSDNKNISEKTKKKVKKVAKKLNYQKNTWASALRTKKTKLLGVIVPSLKNPFFAHAISGMQQIANKEELRIVICQSNESFESEITQLQTLIASGAEGIIVSVAAETKNFDHFKAVEEKGIPVIYFDRGVDENGVNQVEADDFNAGMIATQHLIDQGCKRLAHLAGPLHLRNSRKRKEGFEEAIKKNNFKLSEQFIIETGYESSAFKDEWAERLANATPPVEGIFAVSDHIAIAAMKRLQKNGVKLPEDIKIIGFGRNEFGELVTPTLSTVTQMPEKIGRESVNMYLDVQKTGIQSSMSRQILTEAKLIARESSR